MVDKILCKFCHWEIQGKRVLMSSSLTWTTTSKDVDVRVMFAYECGDRKVGDNKFLSHIPEDLMSGEVASLPRLTSHT